MKIKKMEFSEGFFRFTLIIKGKEEYFAITEKMLRKIKEAGLIEVIK